MLQDGEAIMLEKKKSALAVLLIAVIIVHIVIFCISIYCCTFTSGPSDKSEIYLLHQQFRIFMGKISRVVLLTSFAPYVVKWIFRIKGKAWSRLCMFEFLLALYNAVIFSLLYLAMQ